MSTSRKQLLAWAAEDRAAGYLSTALGYERRAQELRKRIHPVEVLLMVAIMGCFWFFVATYAAMLL